MAAALTLAVGAFGAAACGSRDDDSGGGSSSSSASSTPQGKKIKVGLVTDIGGINDRSFNQLANEGLQRAIKQLGIQGRVLISKQNSDYIPNLTTLAQQKYDLIIGNGFLMADAVATVAKKFPSVKFAIIDQPAALLKGKPQNVVGLPFKEQEAGYLVGYLTALYAKDNGGSLSSVGGQKIPPVDHYIAGFQAARRRPTPASRRLTATRRASRRRTSARRSRSTRSPRARRSSSRSRAPAASARSTPPRRRASRRSGSTPTSPTSARRSSRAR